MDPATQSGRTGPSLNTNTNGKEQYDLGLKYENGRDAYQKIEQAIQCYKLSHQQGHPDALFRIFYIALTYCNHEENLLFFHSSTNFLYAKDMTPYLKPIADQGSAEAMYCLGMFPLPEPGGEANSYIRNSAAAGNKFALFRLGLAEFEKNNYGQAYVHFKESADQGNAEAQFYLGFSYMVGRGVSSDPVKARDYLKQSADSGNPDAQLFLETLYRKGYLFEQDNTQADKYSQMRGNKQPSSWVKEIVLKFT